jgi:hypothetical protein
MVDTVIDSRLGETVNVYRPNPSDSDEEVLSLAEETSSPIITRDRDFVDKHREETAHYGVIFGPGMHHRSPGEVVEALTLVLQQMTSSDLKNTVVRLKRFY